MPKNKLCIVIPAFNEEQVIEGSINVLKNVIEKKHIYVVSDGSTDKTVKIANKTLVNVLALPKNVGKARAIFELINAYRLTSRYKYILLSDADSHLGEGFLKSIEKTIEKKPACIVGNVTSHKKGFISAYRTYEYGLSHLIFKNAQNVMKVITVAPGCASLYRSDVFERLDFSNHTLTEDFDLTLQIHKKKLGQIIFEPKAIVITQDPLTLKDYWNQIVRWYSGLWQNIFLHKLYIPNRKINLEIILLMLDFFLVLASFSYLVMHPQLLIKLVATMYLSMLFFSVLIIAIQKKFWAILYTPLFFLLYLINIIAYIFSFLRVIFSSKKRLSWKKVARYGA